MNTLSELAVLCNMLHYPFGTEQVYQSFKKRLDCSDFFNKKKEKSTQFNYIKNSGNLIIIRYLVLYGGLPVPKALSASGRAM